MKVLRIAAIAAATCAAIAAPAQAQETGSYVGLSLGRSTLHIDEAANNAALNAEGIGHRGFTSDEQDSAWKIYGGYRFNRHFAIEGGLLSLGAFSTSTVLTSLNGVPVTPGTLSVTGKTKEGIHAAGLGILPIGEQAHVFGRLGVYSIKSEGEAVASGPAGTFSMSSSDRTSDLILGLGAGYEFTKNFGVRAEWERYKDTLGQGDVDVLSIGAVYRF